MLLSEDKMDSRKLVIYLQGGGHCQTVSGCEDRSSCPKEAKTDMLEQVLRIHLVGGQEDSRPVHRGHRGPPRHGRPHVEH